MPFQEPGGAARKGKAAGITPRPEQEVAPAPEPEVTPLQPLVEAPVAAVRPSPDTAAVPAVAAGPGPRRIGPAMGEGKLWVRPLPAPPRELAQALARSHVELVDSAVSAIVQAFVDSVLSAPTPEGAKLPSWTTQIGGKTFGIDSKYIYLGGLRIPSAVLALLPIRGGATMEFSQANRLSLIREDLARASARAGTMEDFKRAVRELRAERERLKEIERNQRVIVRRMSDSLRYFSASVDTSARTIRLARRGDTTSIGSFTYTRDTDGRLLLTGTLDSLPTRLSLMSSKRTFRLEACPMRLIVDRPC